MKKKHIIGVALVVLVVLALVGAVRSLVVCLLVVPQDGERPTLLAGDRVVVNRWTYGLRLPYVQYVGYHRYAPAPVVEGDWVAFNNPATHRDALPDTSGVCIGRCLAGPGDTIYVGAGGVVSRHVDYRRGCIWPLQLPARGQQVQVTPWNLELYALTINRHEPVKAVAIGDTLYVHGVNACQYRFQHDYYWMASGNEDCFNDSRTFGFVPSEYVLGQVQTVLYSIHPDSTWYRSVRWQRILRPVQ